jgi:hypothetical protein
MTIEEFFDALAKAVVGKNSTREDVLALMVVLHTHTFQIGPSVVLTDAGGHQVLMPITRNHAAEAVGAAMASLGRPGNPSMWHDEYCRRTPFEAAGSITEKWRSHVANVIERMKASTLVCEVLPEVSGIPMTKEDFFLALAKAIIGKNSTKDEILALMVVFHNHRFEIGSSVKLTDAGEHRVLEGITRNHASHIVGTAMASIGRPGDPRVWHDEYCKKTPFELASEITEDWQPRVANVIERMKASSLVCEVLPDD